MNELEERDRTKDRYYGEALGALENEVLKLRGKDGILLGSNLKILPEKPLALQGKEDGNGQKPGKGWFSWFKTKTISGEDSGASACIGSNEGQEAGEKADPVVKAPEASATPPQSQPSIIDRVRQRTHPRDISPKFANNPAETSRTHASGSKPIQPEGGI